MTVRISDVVLIEDASTMMAENSVIKTNLGTSGIMQESPELTLKANESSLKGTINRWGDVADTEPNYSDDTSTEATPEKIAQQTLEYKIASVNKGFSQMNLVADLIPGITGLQRVVGRMVYVWQLVTQNRLLSMIKGVLANNLANDSGDMVYDASIPSGTNAQVTAANGTSQINGSNVAKAHSTMGEHLGDLVAMIVHPDQHEDMVTNDLITYVKDSQGQTLFEQYMGARVVVSKKIPVVPAAGDGDDDAAAKYTAILFGEGVVGFGEGTVAKPLAIEMNEAAGSGAGQETLWSRKRFLMLPQGHSNVGTPANAITQTLAELEAAASWTRISERENVKIAFLTTN